MGTVHVAIHQFPFATRQVFLRFANGPELDLSFFDMDRLAVEYLKLRGIKLSAQVCDLAKAVPPVQADFMLPTEIHVVQLNSVLPMRACELLIRSNSIGS